MWRFRNTTPIGIHVTRGAVSLAQLQERSQELTVHALANVDLRDLSGKPEEDWNRQAAQRIREAVARHNFSGRKAVCSLSGDELMIQNLRLPQIPVEEIDGAITLEAQERISQPFEELEIRYLKAGEIRQESQIKLEMIFIGVSQDLLRGRIRLLEQAGLDPIAVELEPQAVLRCHSRATIRDIGVGLSAFVHLSDEGTCILLTDGRQISFLKTIPIGSRILDEAVARHLNVDVHDASRMRGALQSVAELDPHDEIHRSIIEAIRQPLESLCVETELCLRYHKVTYRNRPVGELVLTGGETCRWLGEYFQARLGLPCRLANPFSGLREQLRVSQRVRSGNWITSLGLAMHPVTREEAAA